MSQHRHIGLERQDGYDVGRDPRTMSADELEQLGYPTASSPFNATPIAAGTRKRSKTEVPLLGLMVDRSEGMT